ncbi:MAG: hypothetical protein ACRDKB_13840 [Actinomycetota bacterium]
MGRTLSVALVVLALAAGPGASAGKGRCTPHPSAHSAHDKPGPHVQACGLRPVGSVEVSREAGLGQIELHGDVGAVLQRDEGIVALLDLRDPTRPKVFGRYDDGARLSLDGDLAFSDDGKWLFYARQTRQFSKDGIHVLDVADPENPAFTSYQPEGGTLRIAYFEDEGREYVFSLDAINGLVVNRFDLTRGVLVPVASEPLPALKVGGPASAGLYIDRRDPRLGVPLLYVTTGQTGLEIYDISAPEMPRKIASWDKVGLADVEVVATKRSRVVFAATEYWFDGSAPPQVLRLDATRLGSIRPAGRLEAGFAAEETWRVQGIDLAEDVLFAAHSHAGIVGFGSTGGVVAVGAAAAAVNANAGGRTSPYAMDVETRGRLLYVTDAATGTLTVWRH